jgi:4-hydroxy-tetrahydrodipicolinate reductase
MPKIKIGIAGCLGRMGKELINAVESDSRLKYIGGFDKPDKLKGTNLLRPKVFKEADVIIDFSSPIASVHNARDAVFDGCVSKFGSKKTALVIGTTGLSKSQIKQIQEHSKKIPILMSSNMSLGVNLLFELVKNSSTKLNSKDYDIEISETHHKHKVDAPSGTALSLGEFAAKGRGVNLSQKKVIDRMSKSGRLENKRRQGQIGFSVTRGGEIAGEHTVSFIGENDRIDITHKANNRSIFVRGAIEAAIFIFKKKQGLYSVKDMVKF